MTECTEWSQTDGDHFHGLCTNEFEPELGTDGCPICVAPVKAARDLGCWTCDDKGVPLAFTINGSAPGYLPFDNPTTETHYRNITSRVGGGSVVAQSDYRTGAIVAPDGSGNHTLLPDPSPHCHNAALYPPYVNGPNDWQCSYRVAGKAIFEVKIIRPGVYLNNGSFVSFTRPNNGVTDRYYPINQFIPGTQLDFGTFEVSLEQNPHHWRSIIGAWTLLGNDGAMTCKTSPFDPSPSQVPLLYGYADEIEAMRQTLVNPGDGIPVTVQIRMSGFAWVLGISGSVVSGVKRVNGNLRLYRRHSIYYEFNHNGYATQVTPGTGDCATLAFSNSATGINFFPFFDPLQADVPVCINAPIGAVTLPNNPSSPLGWHPNGYAGSLPTSIFPEIVNFDPTIGLTGINASGSFSVPCTQRNATVNLTAGNGLTSSMEVSW